jgi:hypothetical protein
MTPQAGALTVDTLEISMTRYMDIVLGNDYPQDVIHYGDRIFFAAGNTVHISPVNKLVDWDTSALEYFAEGGDGISRLVPLPNRMAVVKGSGIYELYGTNYTNYQKRFVTPEGCIAPRSCVVMDQELYYLSRDGIRGWNGTQSRLLTKHLASLVPADAAATAVAYDGYCIMAFPGTNVALLFDPDSSRERDNGDAAVSVYRFTNYPFTLLLLASDTADSGYLFGTVGTGGIFRLDIGTTDAGTEIEMAVKTVYLTMGSRGQNRRPVRLKVELEKPHIYTMTIDADYGRQAASTTITPGLGSGRALSEHTMPYTLDGRAIAFQFSSFSGGRLYAIYLEAEGRAN